MLKLSRIRSEYPHLLPLFKEETDALILKRVRVTCWLGIVLFLIFNVLDFVLWPQLAITFLYLRLALAAFHGAILITTYKNPFKKYPILLGFAAYLGISWIIVIMSILSGGHISPYYAGINLVVVGYCLLMPWTVGSAVLLSGLIYASYLGGIILFDEISNYSIFINNNFFILCTMVEAIAAAFLWNIYRESQFIDKEKLKALDKMKSRFVSNITHEFRTPLVALSSTIQMILDGSLDDSKLQKKLLLSGKGSLEEMLENVNDLLTKARSERGMTEMKWSEINIGTLVESSINTVEPIARKRDIRLTLINRLGPQVQLYADRAKLKKIINNLIGNAIKFTKEGEVDVVLDVQDNQCRFQVKDTGLGIPKEDLPTIFEAFTQASNNPFREVQGTGLGLSMVKDFVEAHKGTVTVESEVGEGSLFTVCLPLGTDHIDASKIDTSHLIEDENSASSINLGIKSFDDLDLSLFTGNDARKHHVLLVEDNPQVIQVLAYLLKDHYNLHFARDGKEGLEKTEVIKPDLVMSDVMMPRMNGYELVHEIKNRHDLKMIPVIILTSKADVESKIRGIEEGADEYLAKPFNNQEVLTRVRSLIEKRKIEMEFVHAEKLISLGRLVAGIAHEINNPIFYAKSAANSMDKIFKAIQENRISLQEGMQMMADSIEEIKDGTERVCHITESLKSFVRQGVEGFSPNDVHRGIDSTIPLVHTARESKVKFNKQYELDEEVVCNVNQLNQVFLNLLQNAVQALEQKPDGQIWIRTYKEGAYAHIAIKDNGYGISPKIQKNIFDPFFTTKDVGKGTGLGLYVSQQIVHEHGGTLSFVSKEAEGTEFDIQIPIAGKGGENERAKFTHTSIDRGVANIQYPHRG